MALLDHSGVELTGKKAGGRAEQYRWQTGGFTVSAKTRHRHHLPFPHQRPGRAYSAGGCIGGGHRLPGTITGEMVKEGRGDDVGVNRVEGGFGGRRRFR